MIPIERSLLDIFDALIPLAADMKMQEAKMDIHERVAKYIYLIFPYFLQSLIRV